MDLQPYERQAFETIVRALPTSNMPVRRPSFNDPTFWSRPLVLTKIEPVAAGGWVDFLVLPGILNYVYVVNKYVADSFGDNALSGLEFRLVFDGTIPPNFSILPGAEHHKQPVTAFPLVPQKTFFLVEENDNLILQVRNTGVFQQLVCCAFYGYAYNTYMTEKNWREGVTDA